MVPEECPKCHRSLEREGEPGFTHAIGHQEPGVYDGTLWWECPFCHWAWPRFSDGSQRARISQEYVNEHNLLQDLKERDKEGGD